MTLPCGDSNLLDVELAYGTPTQGGLQHQADDFGVGGAQGQSGLAGGA